LTLIFSGVIDLHKLTLFAALLCGLTCAQAAQPLAAPATAHQHPLTAHWTWTQPGGKACTETWHYRANHTRTSISGEEKTISRYEVTALPSLFGFYRVTETVTESNDKPDCAGTPHTAASGPVTRFIQFSPKYDLLIVCRDQTLKTCFGPLKRQ
jgi:hypothetical protein